MLKPIIRTLLFFCFFVVFSEILFRSSVFTASQIPFTNQEPAYKLLTFDTSKIRDGVYTAGVATSYRRKWHVNEQGFLYDKDFVHKETRNKPCIAVIGDSYIESLAVPCQKQFATILQDSIGDSLVVYPFGVPGAGLSEYMQIARYAAENFDPEVFIFAVTVEDVKESYRTDSSEPFFLKFNFVNDTIIECAPTGIGPNPLTRFLRVSAFSRYLYLNLGVKPNRIFHMRPYKTVVTTSESSPFTSDLDYKLQRIATHIVNKLIAEYPKKKFLFVVDGNRQTLYNTYRKPPPLAESRYLKNACKTDNCQVLDLNDKFADEFLRTHQMNSFATDIHWNDIGNRLVANAVFEKLKQLDWLSQSE